MTPVNRPSASQIPRETGFGERIGYILLVAMCVAAVILILLLPAESLFTDLVYRAF